MVDNARIAETLGKMKHYLSSHDTICVSVSGGSDSNIIVHMIATYFREYLSKIRFVFSNTGLEYKATKNHLRYMESRYNIKIEEIRGKSVVSVCKKNGVPFVSKQCSEYIHRLQSHDFDFLDYNIEDAINKFPNAKGALRWWCNDWGDKSRFNIDWNKGLKDFLMQEKPEMKVSAICCTLAKKAPMEKFIKDNNIDLSITGERKSEGGIRAAGSSCFKSWHGIDKYMPLFFWNDETKQYYKESEKIIYSDCYEVWGMERTGCVGCPFNSKAGRDLKVIKKYEPNLYKACINVFGESYRLMDKFEIHRQKIFEDNEQMKMGGI